MKRTVLMFPFMLACGIGAEMIGVQVLYAQQTVDLRVADLVRAGKLRVGLGLGSPVLAVKDAATGATRGPAVDLGRALAARIGVEFVAVEYPRPGAIMDGIRTNAWDVTFLVADSERAAVTDFSAPYMQTDFTYLVMTGSPIRSVADVDRPGVRIAGPRGDASFLLLTRTLKRAELVGTDTLDAAVELVRTGHADGRAAPRPVLLAESARLPGSRVLDDGFASISYVAMVPKGQAGRLAYVSEFIEEAKASGLVKRTIERGGLRGVQAVPVGSRSTQ